MTCSCGRPATLRARTLCRACYERHRRSGQLPALPVMSLEERFFAKVKAAAPLDCWLWSGAVSTSGYGAFKVGDSVVRAHRWSYELFIAEIPGDLSLDHLCRTRKCVNPWHLEPVTTQVNNLRGDSPAAIAVRTRTCGRGHVGEWESGRTQCRACSRGHHARRAADPDWRKRRAAYERARKARANRVHEVPDTSDAQAEHLRRIGGDQ